MELFHSYISWLAQISGQQDPGILLFLFIASIVLLAWVVPLLHIILSSKSSGTEKLGWILAFLVFQWVGWIFFLIFAPVRKNEQKPRGRGFAQCPMCAEFVKKEANICKHCGNKLPWGEMTKPDDFTDFLGHTFENGVCTKCGKKRSILMLKQIECPT